jgi:hypothetical protein
MDAGWYPCRIGGKNRWPMTGTWEPDPERFPRGLRAVCDHAHARGIRTLVWFEPERVVAGTWLGDQRREWLLPPAVQQKDPAWHTSLLNLGHPEALRWLIAHTSRTIMEQGIDLYRQDFNWRCLKQLTEEWRDLTATGYFYGDYYPLTPYNRDGTQWIAWQHHRADREEGLVQAFRRASCTFPSLTVHLRGLDPDAKYVVTDPDAPGRQVEAMGRELMDTGLVLATSQAPQAVLRRYRKRA